MTIARIENGALAEYRSITFGDVPEHKRGQWRTVVDLYDTFDPDRERLTGPAIIVEADRVVRHFTVEPIVLTREDYAVAVDEHIDSIARSRGYASTLSMISYLDSAVPAYAAEAAEMRAWRDQVWQFVVNEELVVLAGERPQPTIAQLIAALPPHPFS